MATATQQGTEHMGKTQGAENHDHDLVQDLSKRLDALWRYDQYIVNAEGKPKLQECWRSPKQQEQENANKLSPDYSPPAARWPRPGKSGAWVDPRGDEGRPSPTPRGDVSVGVDVGGGGDEMRIVYPEGACTGGPLTPRLTRRK